jgi:hypothetical protein
MQNPRSTRTREQKARVLLSLGRQCIQQAKIELDAAEPYLGITADVPPTAQQRHERLRDQVGYLSGFYFPGAVPAELLELALAGGDVRQAVKTR